ncbi:MAG TPA: endolytic transglycosylase MltG [Burkholderiales bacterium]|nr:endolytic transglycosylase MltG [Burkholderiales bacterium]
MAVALAIWFAVYAFATGKPDHLPLQFDLKQGSSLRGTIHQMQKAGAIDSPLRFELLARLLGDTGRIQAGNYEITAPLSPYALLGKITSGDQALNQITLIEGWTFAQARAALDAEPAIKHDTAGLDEQEVLRRLGIDGASAEGLFFPDTYFYAEGTSDLALLRRAHRQLQSQLTALWNTRSEGLPFDTPYQALILASIVEKETGQAGERPLVAAVFINRLKQGMMLQTDPSVIYGLGPRFDGNLHKVDLLTDGPYNTYTRNGLPPTPIALPGLDALKATLNPAPSSALYFVSRGNGTSQFSATLAEHERAVAKYQKHGRN